MVHCVSIIVFPISFGIRLHIAISRRTISTGFTTRYLLRTNAFWNVFLYSYLLNDPESIQISLWSHKRLGVLPKNDSTLAYQNSLLVPGMLAMNTAYQSNHWESRRIRFKPWCTTADSLSYRPDRFTMLCIFRLPACLSKEAFAPIKTSSAATSPAHY